MRLWLLRPVDDTLAPWRLWFNSIFGFIVRAKDEPAARALAVAQPGDEGAEAWLSPRCSTCVELPLDGSEEVVMADYNRTK